ncbi:MAG: hypothetical protein FWG56_09940 [Desulfovibrionaceae bacterium]|jgi:hypothetical protein|nr:hypothetical protein [Desulfovibrionaceae bacterium]
MISGCPRPYHEAVAQDVIDRKVRSLVASLNVEGVCSTFASCEGHGFIRFDRLPYVAFWSDVEFAGALSANLHQESLLEHPSLNYLWSVSGFFDENGKLQFSLEVSQYLGGWWPSIRRKLDADFVTLMRLIEQSVASFAHVLK